MANGFVTNAHRYDPYKNFKFQIIMDDRVVLGVSKVGALKRTTEVVSHREGGTNSHSHKSPGRSEYEAVSLERGVTHDEEFERWAEMVHGYDTDATMDLVNYKKDLTLVVQNERGQPVKRYFLFGCWPKEFTAIPELDANANAVAIESLTLEIEGFKRDVETAEPDESAAI